jgi:hypothetical protein
MSCINGTNGCFGVELVDLAPGAVCVELTTMLAMHYDDDDIDAWKGVYEPRYGHR